MNKKRRRILSFVTALALSASVFPAALITAHAEEHFSVNFSEDAYSEYANGQNKIIAATNNNVVPDPVKVGDITYSAGTRNGGTMNNYASIDNGALKVVSGRWAGADRGVKMMFNPAGGTPAWGDFDTGEVLELSFDVDIEVTGNTTNIPSFTVYNNAKTPTAIQEISATDIGKGNHVRVIMDSNTEDDNGACTVYMIATDKATNAFTGSSMKTGGVPFTLGFGGIVFTGDTGVDNSTFVYTIDNLKIESNPADTGIAKIKVTDAGGNPLGNDPDSPSDNPTVVEVAGMTLYPDKNGEVSVALPVGTHSLKVSRGGYEYAEDSKTGYDGDITVTTGINNAKVIPLMLQKIVRYPASATVFGAPFIAAPKTAAVSDPVKFEAVVLTQNGSPMDATDPAIPDSDKGDGDYNTIEYNAFWEIYPTADYDSGAYKEASYVRDNTVNIDAYGNVTVKKEFTVEGDSLTAEDKVREYTVELTAKHINDGDDYTGVKDVVETAHIFVGESDVLYYSDSEFNQTYEEGSRFKYYDFHNMKMPDVTRSVATLNFKTLPVGSNNTPIGQRTWALAGNLKPNETDNTKLSAFDPIVGLQLVRDAGDVAITAWTDWDWVAAESTVTNNPFSQGGDVAAFKNSFVYDSAYTADTDITVIMDIDNANHYITFINSDDDSVIGILPYSAEVTTIDGAISGMYQNSGGLLEVNEILVIEYGDDYKKLVGDNQFAKVKDSTVTKHYGISRNSDSTETVTWSVEPKDYVAPEPDTTGNITFTLSETPTTDITDAQLIYAVYDNDTNKLAALNISDAPVISANSETVTIEVSQNGTYMLWDSLNGMKPLAPVENFTLGSDYVDPCGGMWISQSGLLTVPDTVEPGEYVITAKGNQGTDETMVIKIEDYQNISYHQYSYQTESDRTIHANIAAESALSLADGEHLNTQFYLTRAVDTLGDNIAPFIPSANITWSSNNESVVTIDETGYATAHEQGEAIITAVLTYNGTEYTLTTTVKVGE